MPFALVRFDVWIDELSLFRIMLVHHIMRNGFAKDVTAAFDMRAPTSLLFVVSHIRPFEISVQTVCVKVVTTRTNTPFETRPSVIERADLTWQPLSRRFKYGFKEMQLFRPPPGRVSDGIK